MRCKQDDQIALSRHVRSKGIVAYFADERDTGKPAHVECFAGDSHETVVQTVRIMVDLIWAHTACEKRVRWTTTFFQQCKVNPLVQLHGELGLREVLLDLHHGFFLDARVVGHCELGRRLTSICVEAEPRLRFDQTLELVW